MTSISDDYENDNEKVTTDKNSFTQDYHINVTNATSRNNNNIYRARNHKGINDEYIK